VVVGWRERLSRWLQGQPGTGQLDAKHVGAEVVDRHPHGQFAASRVREDEHSRAAATRRGDLVDRAEGQLDASFGRHQLVLVQGRCAVAPVGRGRSR